MGQLGRGGSTGTAPCKWWLTRSAGHHRCMYLWLHIVYFCYQIQQVSGILALSRPCWLWTDSVCFLVSMLPYKPVIWDISKLRVMVPSHLLCSPSVVPDWNISPQAATAPLWYVCYKELIGRLYNAWRHIHKFLKSLIWSRMTYATSFWLLKVRLMSLTFLTHLIWPAVISSCFWERNHSYNGTISRFPHDIQEQLWTILHRISESQFQ